MIPHHFKALDSQQKELFVPQYIHDINVNVSHINQSIMKLGKILKVIIAVLSALAGALGYSAIAG